MKKIFILMLTLMAAVDVMGRPISFCYSYETNGMLTWENYDSNSTYHVIWTLDRETYYMSWQNVGQLPMPNAQAGTVAIPFRLGVVLPSSTKPAGMEYIEEGPFVQGGSGFFSFDEVPLHTNYLEAFYMDKFEVSKGMWDRVKYWAWTNGYTDLAAGAGGWNGTLDVDRGLSDHPVVLINWYDAVKWCNARSEAEGLQPAYYYYENGAEHVYRINMYITNLYFDTSKSGYRLPTEMEWEKAARGGLEQHVYPWPSRENGNIYLLITNVMANYITSDDIYEGGTTPVGYYNGSQYVFYSFFIRYPAHDMANGYGLYDMAGNVGEWCWDWYDPNYYTNEYMNFGGPDTGTLRVARGGTYGDSIFGLRCAQRTSLYPHLLNVRTGFRCVRRLSLDE
jgi:sulfatase modifying factor 1